ncbi:MAG: L-fucokinase [Candidatus Aminicenantaceae bacterium]
MNTVFHPWDYLIVTASNDSQAEAYRIHLETRRSLGFLSGIKNVLVVPDPGGKRIGSGGSTVQCWMNVLQRELAEVSTTQKNDPGAWSRVLKELRILIIHAGGDSRRLPAYGPCGKLFIPVPGESDSALGETLFDRLLPVYLELPPPEQGVGQTVITTGDVLLLFDAQEVRFRSKGITGLGTWVAPEVARNHGVFVTGDSDRVRCFAQKPDPEEQERLGTMNRYGRSLLDIGVMNLDSEIAVRLLDMAGAQAEADGTCQWHGPVAEEIEAVGLDFYREVCCAMGTQASFRDYLRNMHDSGVRLSQGVLQALFEAVSDVPFHAHRLSECGFLHFGTMRQLIESGTELLRRQHSGTQAQACLCMNTHREKQAAVIGSPVWVEGCRLDADLNLEGENVVIGADIDEPLSLPRGACLDMLKGTVRDGKPVWFTRVYGISDNFKSSCGEGATFCGMPIEQWLSSTAASLDMLWSGTNQGGNLENILWNARLFPAVSSPSEFRQWLWMLQPDQASDEQKRAWREADRYSADEILALVDQEDFIQRRWTFRAEEVFHSLRRILRSREGLSARELAFILKGMDLENLRDWLTGFVREALRSLGGRNETGGLDRLDFSRIIHTLASAVGTLDLSEIGPDIWIRIWPVVLSELTDTEKLKLEDVGLGGGALTSGDPAAWCRQAQDTAFLNLGHTIVMSTPPFSTHPRNALRSDEIVWARAPARLDIGGGWTDTPPYALENGGCVINAAVDLNGQPPIQVYVRIIEETEIRITSIDHGTRIIVSSFEELLDYREPTGAFGLAKAALALSGLAPDRAEWPPGVQDLSSLLRKFGGGIELTTLAAIPSGSGLGTSSIMGAALISALARLSGRNLTDRELFHAVLQLEQELTTGGGWQDQIGGSLPGVKMITTEPGLVPDPRIHYVPADVLDPVMNNGQTVLYYTGMRRLARNILRNVVGHYLDRDRSSLNTLSRLHGYPPLAADAMSRKDMGRFGELIDLAWKLNKQIDPDSSNPAVEEILERFRPYMIGAKLLGAGGGGFLLVVCESAENAAAARRDLETNPPNPLARFFEYSINPVGLEVTVC